MLKQAQQIDIRGKRPSCTTLCTLCTPGARLASVEVALTILKTENTHNRQIHTHTHRGSYRVRPGLKILRKLTKILLQITMINKILKSQMKLRLVIIVWMEALNWMMVLNL